VEIPGSLMVEGKAKKKEDSSISLLPGAQGEKGKERRDPFSFTGEKNEDGRRQNCGDGMERGEEKNLFISP